MPSEEVQIRLSAALARKIEHLIQRERIATNLEEAVDRLLERGLDTLQPRTAIILAGGSRRVIDGQGRQVVLPLAQIHGKTVLEHLLDLFRHYGITRTLVLAGRNTDMLAGCTEKHREAGMDVRFVAEREPLGTGGALRLARDLVDHTFIVSNADELKQIDLNGMFLLHRSGSGVATMALARNGAAPQYGRASLHGDKVLAFDEKPTGPPVSELINAGLYIFEPAIFDSIPAGYATLERDVFPRLAEEGKLLGYPFVGQWFDASEGSQFAVAQAQWQDINIFKAYDIRGVYPYELNEHVAYEIGLAYANYLQEGPVCVGRDMRLSSPELAHGLIQGIIDGGLDVWDLGLCSTDTVTFAVGRHDLAGGLMVTASHNPPQWNGFKACRRGAEPLSGSVGLDEMRRRIEARATAPSAHPGKVQSREVLEEYARHCLSFVDRTRIRPLTVVVDGGNGMAGKIFPAVAQFLPIKLIPLYLDLDGTFPNHLASPIDAENQEDCKGKVLAKGADLGLLFDGDADRVFLVDEKAQGISGTVLTALIARKMLERFPGATILYNAICGRIVPETIERYGGKGIRTPVGHSLIKAIMRREDAVFAGEHSGHYFFRENYYADSGLIAALLVLEIISGENRPVSEIVAEYDRFTASGEINSEVTDHAGKISELRVRYGDGRPSEIDGLTVEYDDWWFNVRPSNTEPLLRLNVEATTPALMAAKRDELLALIRGETG
jgi:phosphomannomutase